MAVTISRESVQELQNLTKGSTNCALCLVFDPAVVAIRAVGSEAQVLFQEETFLKGLGFGVIAGTIAHRIYINHGSKIGSLVVRVATSVKEGKLHIQCTLDIATGLRHGG